MNKTALRPEVADTVSPLNALWYGNPPQNMRLPQLGHLFLICPLNETVISCAGTTVDSEHYVLLQSTTTISNLYPAKTDSKLLVLMISPGYIGMMADFLQIPADMNALLHAVPLRHGDAISDLLNLIPQHLQHPGETEELFIEVIGEILQLLRLRYHALLNLSHHKQNTIDDLLPRLLQARQFIESDYLEPLKTEDVAHYAALSEYHFSRLFKTAFDMSVYQYILHLRLNRARHLLEASAQSITDISFSVGYNSLSAFINAFRKYFGLTPSAYRGQFQN